MNGTRVGLTVGFGRNTVGFLLGHAREGLCDFVFRNVGAKVCVGTRAGDRVGLEDFCDGFFVCLIEVVEEEEGEGLGD